MRIELHIRRTGFIALIVAASEERFDRAPSTDNGDTVYVFTTDWRDSQPLAKGQWRLWGGNIMARCPECGEIYLLDHEVASDGTVTPSLECPTEGCSFHEMIKLDGWKTDR